ncbi:MAG TPA: hypothetical protein VNA69_24520 [Thermoanaerobaculia bacterium]|nr:hypothetical protein [Thermoanaerobaculia bacterium]
MSLLFGALAVLGIVLAVAAVVAFAVSALIRDRGKHGTSGSMSAAMLEVQSILEPGKKKVVETMRKEEEQEEEDHAGDT